MPPKRKAAEATAERITKSRRGGAKEPAAAKSTKTTAKRGVKQEKTKPAAADGLDPSSFTLEGVQAMFENYMDEDDNNVIGGKS